MIPFYENREESISCGQSDNFSFPPHLHAHLELIYPQDCGMSVTIGGTSCHLTPGDLAVIFPNVIHSYDAPAAGSSGRHFAMIICSAPLLGENMNTLLRQRPVNPVLRHEELDPDVAYAVRSLLDKCAAGALSMAVAKALVHLILAHALDKLELRPERDLQSADLPKQVISYVSENYCQPITLDMLSHATGVSKYYLSRVFSQKLHMGFRAYVNTMRVYAAQRRLRTTEDSILQIGYDCGFENQRTFNRVFREQCGMSPRAYREAK